MTVLTWWSGNVESHILASGSETSAQTRLQAPSPSVSQRRELIETLDRLVAYEHYYRSVYGHFTKLISRVGYSVPASLSELYDLRVSESSRDQLRITAFSESEGQTQDLVTINQDFQIQANFILPEPRLEYLRAVALKQLRILRDSPTGQAALEYGVFKGYFRYDLQHDKQGHKLAVAMGMRVPVMGLQLELADGQAEAAEIAIPASLLTGEKPPSGGLMSTLEETFLAQRIFRGETGRYAKNWSELSQIARFKFEDRDRYSSKGTPQVPFGESDAVLEIDQNNQEAGRIPSSEGNPLEIEAISSEEN